MADDPERTVEAAVDAVEAEVDEAAGLRARIATLEVELNKMRSEVARLNREERQQRRAGRSEGRQDRVETIREIVERADGEGRRAFRALVLSQMEQMRLTADLFSSFASRVERDLPRDLMDGWLETIDRSLDIPEKTISTFEETYKQAPRTRRAARAD